MIVIIREEMVVVVILVWVLNLILVMVVIVVLVMVLPVWMRWRIRGMRSAVVALLACSLTFVRWRSLLTAATTVQEVMRVAELVVFRMTRFQQ